MSDTLLSNAKNMNAKDEKFIFQGVYNLLYGTVELLMVSANDAAVNGNTNLLSSDQLKVHFCKMVAGKKTELRLKRLERVLRCTRARNLHQDARVS